MSNLLIERLSLLWLLSLSCAFVDAAGSGFYQHIEIRDPASAVESLRTDGWLVREHEPLMLEPPIDWSASPQGDSNWSYQLNAMYPLAPVFQLLENEYRNELHELARAVFDDWISFNLEADIDHTFRWNDMATGVRATYLAQLIHHELVSGGEPYLSRYLDAGVRHLEELTDPTKLAESNHGLFQLVGIAALCEVMKDALCVEADRYAEAQYLETFRRQFNHEGMHLEHSPEYHLLALRTFSKIEASGLLRLNDEDRETLTLAANNLSLLMHPDGAFVAVGDTEPGKANGAARYDPAARWLLSEGTEGAIPRSGLWLFPDTGYAVFREQDSREGAAYLFFTVAHHSRNHKHVDTGSFEWSDRGQRVLIDSGKWGYDDSEERRYFISVEAHNTVETEGVDNSPGDLPAEPALITSFRSGPVFGLSAKMRVPRKFIDAEFRRTIVGLPNEWLIVVDEISEALSSVHTSWYHLAPEFDLEALGDGVYKAAQEERPARLVIFPLLPVSSSSDIKGASERRMLGWYSPEYGVLKPNWQIGYQAHGRTVRMATVFRWFDDQSSVTSLAAESDMEVSDDRYELCWLESDELKGVRLKYDGDGVRVTACE